MEAGIQQIDSAFRVNTYLRQADYQRSQCDSTIGIVRKYTRRLIRSTYVLDKSSHAALGHTPTSEYLNGISSGLLRTTGAVHLEQR